MKFHPDKDIDSLRDLLDDEDEAVAVYAMGELLDREQRLGDVLGYLQEFPDARLRMRVHQLQAVITLRNRRRRFREMLMQPDFQLKQGLIEVHLQWFDNDSKPELEKRWAVFLASAGNGNPLDSLEAVSIWMRKYGMTAQPESALIPENYCVGTVLDSRQGAASLVCAIGLLLLDDPGVQVVRVLGDFALQDAEGRLLLPLRDWRIEPAAKAVEYEKWDARSLVKFASHMLFSHAVTSDSFRYIQTIGQALSGVPDGMLPETFPYPYRAAEDPEKGGDPAAGEVI